MMYCEDYLDWLIRFCTESFAEILAEAEGNRDWDIIITAAREALARLAE